MYIVVVVVVVVLVGSSSSSRLQEQQRRRHVSPLLLHEIENIYEVKTGNQLSSVASGGDQTCATETASVAAWRMREMANRVVSTAYVEVGAVRYGHTDVILGNTLVFTFVRLETATDLQRT